MKMRRLTRCLTAWIASLAMLLAGFAPALAHALAPDVRAGMLAGEICTTAGAAMSKADQDGAGIHLQHCPDCYTHGAAAGLPPLHPFSLPMLNVAGRAPSLFYQSPAPLFVWASAQSRAPPLLS